MYNEKKINRNAYIWNTAGSMLNAFQSVIMLMVLTRVCDLVVAGIFTIAYANASLFLNVGNYGMRNFQASDILPQFTFKTYLRSRVLTGSAMLIGSLLFLAFSAVSVGYSAEKIAAIILMTFFKMIDTAEDIFDGNFQQHGRLDIGGRLQTGRVGSTIVVFCVCAALSQSLIVSLAVATVYSLVFLVGGLLLIKRMFGLPAKDNGTALGRAEGKIIGGARSALSSSIKSLLKDCFPLFLAAFLLFYVGNAPKYAIDALMNDVAQAQYGFIAMPVFIVSLLAQFVYMPLIEPLSGRWSRGEGALFLREFVLQVGIVALITIACDVAAFFLGIPVLGWLYATDLQPFLVELIILVAGGGFLALASLFTMGITIMRKQRKLVWGYVSIALIALVIANPCVQAWGITGASWCYFLCMLALAIWFGVVFYISFKQGMRLKASRKGDLN